MKRKKKDEQMETPRIHDEGGHADRYDGLAATLARNPVVSSTLSVMVLTER